MNAPALITTRPILRPDFTSALAANLDEWVTANLFDLVAYFDALESQRAANELPLCFIEFCQQQYENAQWREDQAQELES